MTDSVQSDTHGLPNYEQRMPASHETTAGSSEQKPQDRTTRSYNAEDIQKYGIDWVRRETIDATINRQEWEEICLTSEETKTTE